MHTSTEVDYFRQADFTGPIQVKLPVADHTPAIQLHLRSEPLPIEVTAQNNCNKAEVRDTDQAINDDLPNHDSSASAPALEALAD
jgi:hypothetical protein